jgi:hypothetical protein
MRFIFTAVTSLLLAAAAHAQPGPVYQGRAAAPANGTMDFCATGRFLLFTGNCYLPGDSPYKDSISAKACAGVNAVLTGGLSDLYPNARVYVYNDLSADSVRETLMQSAVLGFFFIGEGDANGGLMTGTDREAFYPEAESCISLYDVFGGFTSHSKYSPDVPAPPRLRKRILAKTELIYRGAGAPAGSWAKLCYPKVSLVYPTRTYAGRMKKDAAKLIGELQEQKKKQVLEVLKSICGTCDSYAQSGGPLAQLCPPQSDACGSGIITPDTAKIILENYCYAIHPELAPPQAE